jgi:hypothetical protein
MFYKQAKNCPICKNHITNSTNYINKNFPTLGIDRILFCDNCGFGWVANPPRQKDLKEFYSKEYRKESSPYFIDFKNQQRALHMSSRSLAQLLLARIFFLKDDVNFFLDVGPGIGLSFEIARSLLKAKKLIAIEFGKKAKRFYKKIYNASTIENISTLKETADIILSSHSLEHFEFYTALEFIFNMKKKMNKNSLFIIEVPHVDLRIHKKIRGQDDPHMMFFSKKSLKNFLELNNLHLLFIDTCGEKYDDNKLTNYENNKNFNNYIRILINYFPFLKKIISTFLGEFLRSRINLDDTNFCYSGNRVNLRAVAKLK